MLERCGVSSLLMVFYRGRIKAYGDITVTGNLTARYEEKQAGKRC